MRRVAVVTGAASGIGLGIARRFAAEGKRVALLDRDADLAERAKTPGGSAAACSFRCSDDGYVTGQVIGVNGGSTSERATAGGARAHAGARSRRPRLG